MFAQMNGFQLLLPEKIARDALLPVDRRSLVKQLGLAVMIALGKLSVALTLLVALYSLWVTATGGSGVMAVTVVICFGLLQVWNLGVTIWIGRFKGDFLKMLAFSVGVILTFSVLHSVTYASDSANCPSITSVVFVAVLALAGLGLIYNSYRYWLQADLD